MWKNVCKLLDGARGAAGQTSTKVARADCSPFLALFSPLRSSSLASRSRTHASIHSLVQVHRGALPVEAGRATSTTTTLTAAAATGVQDGRRASTARRPGATGRRPRHVRGALSGVARRDARARPQADASRPVRQFPEREARRAVQDTGLDRVAVAAGPERHLQLRHPLAAGEGRGAEGGDTLRLLRQGKLSELSELSTMSTHLKLVFKP